MNVGSLIDGTYSRDYFNSKDPIELTGWLVIIDAQLFLLDENLADPYTETKKIKISEPLIAYSVRDVISPLGGGGSFVFHKAKIIGLLQNKSINEIQVIDLFIENDNHNKFIHVDINCNTIKKAMMKYGNTIMQKRSIKSKDWLDYF